MCLCGYVHVYMYMYACGGEACDLVSFLTTSYHIFITRTLTESGAYRFGESGWPVDSRNAPVSTILGLGLQTHAAIPAFCMGTGDQGLV